MSDIIRLASEKYVNQEIPTKISELENDSGYAKEHVIVNDLSVGQMVSHYNNKVPMYYEHITPNSTLPSIVYLFPMLYKYDTNGGFMFGGFIGNTMYIFDKRSGETKWSVLTREFANASDIPTKLSDIENDVGYVTKASFTAVIEQTTYEELLDAINKGYSVFAHAGGVASGVTLPMTMQILASETTTPYPVYMEGYKHVTISDFVDTDGNQMTDKIYQGDGHYLNHLNNIDDLGGTMVSMKVKFAEASYTNRIDIGGNAEWTGFSINPNTEGNMLNIIDNYNIAGGDSNVIAQISKDDVNVNSFVGEEFLLQIGFSYTSSPHSGSSLAMYVYMNGTLCNNGKYFSIESPINKGSYMNVYLENSTSAITLSSVNVEDWFDIIQFISTIKMEKEYYIAEANCNHLPDGSTVWSTQELIKIPQDYITHKTLKEKSTTYKMETVLPNSNFYLREKGLYIICGYDYDLNFYNASGELQGEDNCLSIIVFCTEADANGNFSVFAMQNYKGTLGVSSIKSLVLPGLNGNAYIKNTNTNEGSVVYYMRQNEV